MRFELLRFMVKAANFSPFHFLCPGKYWYAIGFCMDLDEFI
jgi:hypothetical protein